MEIRIYYEDTDSGGIVYHSNYLKFCERARSELFFKKNQSPQSDEGGFVVHSLSAKYISALCLGDVISVELEVLESKSSAIVLRHKIYKIFDMQKQETLKQEVFLMDAKIVFIKQGKIKKIPQEFMELINGTTKD